MRNRRADERDVRQRVNQDLGGLFGPADVVPKRRVYGGDVPLHRGATDTEAAAADKVRHVAPTLRAKVLAWVRAAGANGLTAIEASARYAGEKGLHPTDSRCRNAVAPRLTELRQGGFVEDGGQRRGGAIAWVATNKSGDGAVCEVQS